MAIKKKIKGFVYYFACISGLLSLWRKFNKDNIVILMVHGVMEENKNTLWVPLRPQISPAYLEKALIYIKNYYNFISLGSAVEMLKGTTPIRPNAMVMTFDDGYRNNVKYALPILKKLDIPATFFLPTGHIDKRIPFWFDRLDYALQQLSNSSDRTVNVAGRTIKIKTTNRIQLRNSYKQLRDIVKSKNLVDTEMVDEFNNLSERLEKESGKRLSDIFEIDDWSAVLSWDEIQAINDPMITWGSHGVDHLRLNLISEEIVYKQLIDSKKTIEEKLDRECFHLCYPDGGYTSRVTEIVYKCGYKSAVSVDEGINRNGCDLMKLKRIPFPFFGNKYELINRVAGIK